LFAKHDTVVLSTHHFSLFLWKKDAVEVQVAFQIALQEIAHGFFQKCFKQLYKRWQTYVVSQGQCSEGSCI
jgi:hypothetical protein